MIKTSRVFKRLRSDFQLSIITLMCLLGVVGVSPYAVYRLSQGNYVVGVADVIIVLSAIFTTLYAWRTGDTVKPGIFASIILSSASTLIAIRLGVNGLFWIYPLILFNFFMVSPGKALSATVLVMIGLVSYALAVPGTVFESDYQMTSFLVTSLTASVLSFIFASRTRNQRDQLQLLSVQDPLTGARNRRAMNDELKIASATQRRHGDQYAVLVMDLDSFKQINDTYGHQAGDEVLKQLADMLSAQARSADVVCRFGGEEFLLLLPNMPQAVALERAEQWQRDFAANTIVFGEFRMQATLSIGLASYPGHGTSAQALIRSADRALYRAKTEGRNRVVVAELPFPMTHHAT